MGAIFLFLLAVLSAILGLFVFIAYMYMFVFVGFIIASIAIFYFYGVAWGLAWLGLWWVGGYLISKSK
ncbi:hypothetical protein ACWIWK_05200 [Helicobacter sp. 23-1048]